MNATRISGLRRTLAVVVCSTLLSACVNNDPEARIAAGKKYLDRSEFGSAVIEFKGALQKNDQSPEARLLLGKALLSNGDPVAAAIELNKASALKVPDDQVIPSLARALLLGGQASKLTGLYAETRLADPAAIADLKLTLALAWSITGNRELTEKALAQSIAANPEYTAARVLQARLLASDGKFDQAGDVVSQALGRTPRDLEALQLQAELLWHVKGMKKEAEKIFLEILAVDKKNVAAHSSLISMSLQGNDIPGMRAGVQRLKAVLPRHPQTRFVEAQLAFVERDFKKARELAQILMQSAPEHLGTLLLAASIELQDGSLLQAESLLSKAIRIDPKAATPRQLLAKTHLRSGQPSKALQVLRPLIEAKGADIETIAMAAEALLQTGDIGRSESLFRQAEKANPDDPRLKSASALARISLGQVEAGMNDLANIAASDKSSFADLALISTRLSRNEFDQALVAANGLLKKSPENTAALTMRARVHAARDDLASARTDLAKALSLEPAYFPAASLLAAIDFKQGKPDDAKRRLQSILSKDPRAYPAAIALADLGDKVGDPPTFALGVLADAIKASPSESSLRLRLVDHHLRNKDTRAALDAAQAGSAAAPESQELLDALGRAQMATGDLQQAINTFRRLAGANPQSALPHLRLSDAYSAMRNRAAAETSLKKALSLQPELPEAQRRLVNSALADNRPKDALVVAREIQKQRPRDEAGYLMEGDIHLRMKNTDAAIAAFNAGVLRTKSTPIAIQLHATLINSGKVAAANHFASTWEKEGNSDTRFDAHLASLAILRRNDAEAVKRLTRVVAAQPGNPVATNNLAMLLLDTGAAGALEYAEKANSLLPNQPAFMDTWARALAVANQLPKALEMQKSAVSRAPEELSLRLTLAKIALKAGDKELARSELEKLKKQGARFAGQAEVSALLKSI